MKRLRVYGAESERKSLLRDSALFFISELFPRKRRWEIMIRLKPNLMKDEVSWGYMECLSPYSYVITLDADLDEVTQLQTLAHEMVHVKQFHRGELSERGPVFKWKGSVVDPAKVEYDDFPWEIEAEEMQQTLYSKFDKYRYDKL